MAQKVQKQERMSCGEVFAVWWRVHYLSLERSKLNFMNSALGNQKWTDLSIAGNFSSTLKGICTLIGKSRSRLKYIKIQLKEFSCFHFISPEGLFATDHECRWRSYSYRPTATAGTSSYVAIEWVTHDAECCQMSGYGAIPHTAYTSPHGTPSCFYPFCAIPTFLLVLLFSSFCTIYASMLISFRSLVHHISTSFSY